MRVIARIDLPEKKGIHYSDTHLRRLERAGKFPKSFSLVKGGRRSYDEDEIDAHLRQRAGQAA